MKIYPRMWFFEFYLYYVQQIEKALFINTILWIALRKIEKQYNDN
jgi:hypothetical protein